MFNLARIRRFWFKVLRNLLPLYAGILALALLAMLTAKAPASGLRLVLGLALAAVPVTLAIILAFHLSARFMRDLYSLKGTKEPFWFLVHCLFGQAGFKPWVMLEHGEIDTKLSRLDSMIVQAGGSGNLVIRKDTAVVLEQAGKITRVEGPGFPHLERFERVYATVDLRPTRWEYAVSALSKEGIPITCMADIVFQVKGGSEAPSAAKPFPIDEQTILTAATCTWVREENRIETERVMDWGGRTIISATEGALRFILARYPLDRLIAPERAGTEHPRQVIRRELEAELNKAVGAYGARILTVEIGPIKVEDPVTQQWIESWRAEWDRWTGEYMAAADAAYVDAVEGMRAEIAVKKISNTANVLHTLARQGRTAFTTGALVQLFLGMRNIGSDSLALTYMPTEVTKLLQNAARLSPPPDDDSSTP